MEKRRMRRRSRQGTCQSGAGWVRMRPRAWSRAGVWAARSFKQRDSVKWNGNEKECQLWKTADNCNLFAEPPTVLSAWVFGESIARLYLSVLHYRDATHTHSSENAIYYAAFCATGVVRETTSMVHAGTVEDSEQASWLKARSKATGEAIHYQLELPRVARKYRHPPVSGSLMMD